MEINEHIKKLKEYCQLDFLVRNDTKEKSDFDVFCENHIADIEALIEAYFEEKKQKDLLQQKIDYLASLRDCNEEFEL